MVQGRHQPGELIMKKASGQEVSLLLHKEQNTLSTLISSTLRLKGARRTRGSFVQG